MSDDLTAAGGWSAPSETIYNSAGLIKYPFPEVAVRRGGLRYKQHTPAESAARDAVVAHLNRLAQRFAQERRSVEEEACVIALVNGWDIHFYDPPTVYIKHWTQESEVLQLRCIGIEFTPAAHVIPTIHRHACPDWLDDDWT